MLCSSRKQIMFMKSQSTAADMVYDSPVKLAHLCRELRERGNLTQQQLADIIGEKTKQAVSNAETATDSSRLAIQRRILEHFGKHVDVVYEVTGD